MPLELRNLGRSDLQVTPIALGCWPIAGMTTLDVNRPSSLATIRRAYECGINHFDTAYCYGLHGESEELLATALDDVRSDVSIATKCGISWDAQGERINDARPGVLRDQVATSLRRLRTDRVDLLYLHSPDGKTPIEEIALAFSQFVRDGWTRAVGVSNASLAEIQRFHAVCPIAAVQLRHNVLQRQIEEEIVPWCQTQQIGVAAYWPLMKGLLAGKLRRGHAFDPGDSRLKYEVYRGVYWDATQTFLDVLDRIAARQGKSVAQVVVNWSAHRSGITTVLCGAKRPEQIAETAGALGWKLESASLAEIEEGYAAWRRGTTPAPTG